ENICVPPSLMLVCVCMCVCVCVCVCGLQSALTTALQRMDFEPRPTTPYSSSTVQSAPALMPGLRRVSTDMEASKSNSRGVTLPEHWEKGEMYTKTELDILYFE